MNRCLRPGKFTSALLVGLAFVFTGPVGAQDAPVPTAGRSAPAHAKAAWLRVVQTPLISLDGVPDRLSPGARIRSPQLTLVLPATLMGQAVPVRYVRDAQGLVHEVWIQGDAPTAH